MANELNLKVQLSASKNSASVALEYTKAITMTGNKMFHVVQNVGTAAEALTYGDAGAADVGMMWVRNLDGTNYVEIALDSGVSTQVFAKLLAGQGMLLPPKTAAIYAKANTAACDVEVITIQL